MTTTAEYKTMFSMLSSSELESMAEDIDYHGGDDVTEQLAAINEIIEGRAKRYRERQAQ